MEDRTFIEWDKDDIDALGMMKVDVLALGMLTCIRKALRPDAKRMMAGLGARDRSPGGRGRSTTCCKGRVDRRLPGREPGADQHAAAAAGPKEFYDLVIQVAIVRPGPIQGDMVHPYLRRRNGAGGDRLPLARPAARPATN